MKKNTIASITMILSVGSIANAAQAQSQVGVYGIIDASVNYTSKATIAGLANATGSKISTDSGVNSGSRLGFKGTEDLGGGLSSVFQLETGFKSDTGALDGTNNGVANTNTLFRRLAVVGLSAGWGTVLLGRQTDAVYQYNQWTSVGDFGGITGAVGHNLDRLEGTRVNNAIRYNSPVMAGFSASMLYGFGEVAGQNASGQSTGIGAQYINGPLALFGAYFQSRLTADATATSSDTATLVAGNGKAGDVAIKVMNLGVSYQAGPARWYANGSQVRQPLATTAVVPASGILPSGYVIGGQNNDKTRIAEIGVNYALSSSLALISSVQRTTVDYAGSHASGRLTQFNIGVDTLLSKRTDIYTVIAHLRADNTYNPGAEGTAAGLNNNQTVLTLGVRHKF